MTTTDASLAAMALGDLTTPSAAAASAPAPTSAPRRLIALRPSSASKAPKTSSGSFDGLPPPSSSPLATPRTCLTMGEPSAGIRTTPARSSTRKHYPAPYGGGQGPTGQPRKRGGSVKRCGWRVLQDHGRPPTPCLLP